MVLDTGTAILILGAFVLPGFITLTLRERLYIVRGEDSPFERLLSALLYSAIIYGTLLLTVHWLGLQKSDLVEFHEGEKSLGEDLLAAFAGLLLMPGLIALAGSLWMKSNGLRPWLLHLIGSSKSHSSRSAWNQVFADLGPCLVRATLTDGRIVGGVYDEDSISGYTEEVPDLYLSRRWDLDRHRWFVGPTARSAGLLLSSESIASLEFYDMEDAIDLDQEIRKIKG